MNEFIEEPIYHLSKWTTENKRYLSGAIFSTPFKTMADKFFNIILISLK